MRFRSSYRIQESLLHALNSHQTNWPTLIQNHALSLLRSGEVSSYPDLLRRVLEDIRNDSMSKATASANGESKKVNGNSDKTSLAIPDSVIEDALKVTRESLEAVCDVEDTTST
jgi:hypothetical protein